MTDIKNINLLDVFTYYTAPIEDVSVEYREMFDDDEEYAYVPAYALESYDNADFQEFARDEFIEYVYELLGNKDYKGFIGFNYKANWRGSSGYNTSKDLEDILLFDYDYSLYFQDSGNDIVKFIMSSHDVPTGGNYYVIGILEEDDYYFLENEASFAEVKQFIEQYIRVFMSKESNEPIEEAVANSASMVFDTGLEAEHEFSLNGWNIVSLDKMAKAASVANHFIERQGYKFINNVGLYGGFNIPVTDYDILYNIVIDAVEEVIEGHNAPGNQKSKKWDQSKWDKPRK